MNERRPLSIIRAQCVGCVAGEFSEVRNCTGNVPFGALKKPCPLWPYRSGHRPRAWDTKTFGRRYSPKAAIRRHCLICMTNSAAEVKLCTSPDCASFRWRCGTPPQFKRQMPPPTERQRQAHENLARIARGGRESGSRIDDLPEKVAKGTGRPLAEKTLVGSHR